MQVKHAGGQLDSGKADRAIEGVNGPFDTESGIVLHLGKCNGARNELRLDERPGDDPKGDREHLRLSRATE